MMMTMILEFLFLLISAVVDVIRFDLCLLQLRAFDPLAFAAAMVANRIFVLF